MRNHDPKIVMTFSFSYLNANTASCWSIHFTFQKQILTVHSCAPPLNCQHSSISAIEKLFFNCCSHNIFGCTRRIFFPVTSSTALQIQLGVFFFFSSYLTIGKVSKAETLDMNICFPFEVFLLSCPKSNYSNIYC